MDTKMKTVERLAIAMKASGVRKVDLAKRCGVTEQAVGQWFKSGNVTKENLAIAAALVGKTADELITGKPPAHVNEEVGPLSPEEETLVLAWRALPDTIRRHIHMLCTDYAAEMTALPILKSGSYERAERANKPIEEAQRKARGVGVKR